MCLIEGCQRAVFCRGWCSLHYGRWQRQGDPLAVKPTGSRGKTTEERFLSYIRLNPTTGCVEWTGILNNKGYGRFYVPGKVHYTSGKNRNVLAHRWAWQRERGPIPEGARVLHRCDNPACVNVNHLFLGSQKDNMADAKAKGHIRNQYIKGTP